MTFTLFNFIDFVGMLINVFFTIYIARLKTWSWPVGIVGALLSMVLYIYLDMASVVFLQIVYVFLYAYGWFAWRTDNPEINKQVTRLKANQIVFYIILTIILCCTFYIFNFTTNSWMPFFSAITTGITFTALILVVNKHLENWFLWCLVNVMFFVLNIMGEAYFHALQSVIFFFTTVYGFYFWQKSQNQQSS